MENCPIFSHMKFKTLMAILLILPFIGACGNKSNQAANQIHRYLSETTYQILGFDNYFGLETLAGRKSSPEAVVENFVIYLAEGSCDKAMKLATGDAKQTVQEIKDAGCKAYDTKIEEIDCEFIDGKFDCSCEENRDGLIMTYNYDLVKIKRKWLVESFEKDLNVEDLNLDSEPAQDNNTK